jgi:hypothetical protein
MRIVTEDGSQAPNVPVPMPIFQQDEVMKKEEVKDKKIVEKVLERRNRAARGKGTCGEGQKQPEKDKAKRF